MHANSKQGSRLTGVWVHKYTEDCFGYTYLNMLGKFYTKLYGERTRAHICMPMTAVWLMAFLHASLKVMRGTCQAQRE